MVSSSTTTRTVNGKTVTTKKYVCMYAFDNIPMYAFDMESGQYSNVQGFIFGAGKVPDISLFYGAWMSN